MRLLDDLMGSIEHDGRLDPVADKMAAAADTALSSEVVTDALSGTWLGHPVHPMLIAMPIGSWVSASVMDLTGGDAKAARRLVGLGILSAVPTAASGLNDWRSTSGPERRLGVVHAVSNSVALTLYGASWVARGRGKRGIGAALSLAGSAVLSWGGYLGGHLSYALGVGVDTNAFERGPGDWTEAGSAGDIPEAGMVERNVHGMSILLARVDGEIVAIGNRCTHRGGPLSEGERDGECVRCPWHGSVFALDDGEVQQGPASRPQPAFDVRVTGDTVEVKRRAMSSLQEYSAGD